jgi:hypothetical protein
MCYYIIIIFVLFKYLITYFSNMLTLSLIYQLCKFLNQMNMFKDINKLYFQSE